MPFKEMFDGVWKTSNCVDYCVDKTAPYCVDTYRHARGNSTFF